MRSRTFALRDQWAAHHPALDTSPMEVIGLIKWISWGVDRAVAPLYEDAPLSRPELELLLPLRHSTKPMIARRLAEWMKLTPAAISKTLARLEKRRLILRKPCPTNHRAALVFLTQEGRDAIDAIFLQQLKIEAALLKELGDARPGIVTALHQLLDAIEHDSDEAGKPSSHPHHCTPL